MPLETFSIDRFRNLRLASLVCSAQLNLFIGPNAAGKTSVLEALYVLARARSFRTRHLSQAIQSGCDRFEVTGKVRIGSRQLSVGVRQTEHDLVARVAGQPVQRLSDLAALFPVQWVGGNLHRLVEDGPAYRRQYLDWGLFHVKQGYIPAWRRFQRLLKQRNAGLRAGRRDQEIRAWDSELATAGEALHDLRSDYVALLTPAFQIVMRELLGSEQTLELRYRAGWRSEQPYAEALAAGLGRDREAGYTHAGPHRADLVLNVDERPAAERLSRGQQKLMVIGLQVGQAQVLRDATAKTSLFLVDDLTAELDRPNQRRIMALLHRLEAQVFTTAIELPDVQAWEMNDVKRFHVKRGTLAEMV